MDEHREIAQEGETLALRALTEPCVAIRVQDERIPRPKFSDAALCHRMTPPVAVAPPNGHLIQSSAEAVRFPSFGYGSPARAAESGREFVHVVHVRSRRSAAFTGPHPP